jgi:hypothetical protein
VYTRRLNALAQLTDAVAYARVGAPFGAIGPGYYWKPGMQMYGHGIQGFRRRRPPTADALEIFRQVQRAERKVRAKHKSLGAQLRNATVRA